MFSDVRRRKSWPGLIFCATFSGVRSSGRNCSRRAAHKARCRRYGGIVSVRLHLRKLAGTAEADDIELIAEGVTELRALCAETAPGAEVRSDRTACRLHLRADFNDVIGAILGWAELGLEQNRKNPKAVDRFSRIREQSERAATLTRVRLPTRLGRLVRDILDGETKPTSS